MDYSNYTSQRSCDDDCSAADCESQCNVSTRTAVTCCQSVCRNPYECSDNECCRDSDCLRSTSLPAPYEHDWDHGVQGSNINDYPGLLDYATDDSMPCRWLETDQPCEAFAPTKDALSQHVFQEHIGPQTQQKCWWDDCSLTVDSQQFTEHLLHTHQPSSYVCLWQGCKHKFPDAEQLAQHMELMHSPSLNCHWGGCEVARADPAELTSHVNYEHLNMQPDATLPNSQYIYPTPFSKTSGSFSSIRSAYEQQELQTSASSAIATPSSPYDIDQHPKRPALHRCLWVIDDATGARCRACYEHANELQTHIESAHTKDFTDRGQLRADAFVCKWHLCKRERKPMQHRTALNKHMRSHAEFYTLVCKYCSKHFDDRAKLGNHERCHTKEKPFECKQCPGKFSSKEALATHVRTHTGMKPLECDVCSYRTGDASNMSKHRKTHKTPIHFCEVCKKGFCRGDSLKRHMQQHEPEKAAGQKRGHAEMETNERPPKRGRPSMTD